MTRDEYLARMDQQLQNCLRKGAHLFVHGHRRIYCWECFHNGMEDGATFDYAVRERIAAAIPLDVEEMKVQRRWPFDHHVVPVEYRDIFKG
jgi:hypothetical protein